MSQCLNRKMLWLQYHMLSYNHHTIIVIIFKKRIDRALNPEQPGPSSSIRLKAVCSQTFCADFVFVIVNGQQYPLPCCKCFRFPKWVQQGRGYRWTLLALGCLFSILRLKQDNDNGHRHKLLVHHIHLVVCLVLFVKQAYE